MKNLSSILRGTNYGTLPLANGGTGAASAADALTALGAQPTLISNTNIKTINGSSILGTGDITIAANNYVLPTASTTALGGVRVDGTSISISNGVISTISSNSSIANLTDVTLTTPLNSDFLRYDSTTSKWINKTVNSSFRANFSGLLEIMSSNIKYYPANNIGITSVSVDVGVAPTIASTVVVNKNATPVLTIPIAAGVTRIANIPLILSLSTTEFLTVTCNLTTGKDLSLTFTHG